ncbi:DUF5009 domain-containing protein [Aquimarina sp. AU119]|uniref:heparan-alpha-glucosaminide N-acetyltransferase domain-containing protein n=1 Tax=Aquimarina sp. AU119 TaxID=2108528 RepID=UPI000D68D1E0|nr:DUF5009 domain-containing protein [Aquimarina sp. AU119]
MTVKENLYTGRITSIDVFRGITIFAMIFVNELAGVQNVPLWMKHALAEEDRMTFVDIVFPAFLFIVGMSIPFAINTRLKKGGTSIKIWTHTIKRTVALLVMGLYMVNAEYGYNEAEMFIPIALWGFLAYTLPIPIWNQYSKSFSKLLQYSLQYGAIGLLIIMYFLYVQDTGEIGMTIKWWGILGLIGWAYLITFIAYWFTKGTKIGMLVILVICIGINIAHAAQWDQKEGFTWIGVIGSHFAHTSIVVAGVITSLFFFENNSKRILNLKAIVFAVFLFAIGYGLRPYFEVSKIRATPSWCLYTAGICVLLYYLLYYIIEVKKIVQWSNFIMPAASNPLLIYIIPGIILYLNMLLGIHILPEAFTSGIPGILWSLIFTIIMVFIVQFFNKVHIKLRL